MITDAEVDLKTAGNLTLYKSDVMLGQEQPASMDMLEKQGSHPAQCLQRQQRTLVLVLVLSPKQGE